MPLQQSTCPSCNKPPIIKKEFSIAARTVYSLECGHIVKKDDLNNEPCPTKIQSIDYKTLMNFQVRGVNFGLESGKYYQDKNPDSSNVIVRCLIADEMGLGKTVQSLGMLACNPNLMPALIVVKAATMTQWQREVMRWLGFDYMAQCINSADAFFLPGLKVYITSYDMIPRLMKKDRGEFLKNQIKALGIKTLILDECQQIRNPEAKRTQDVREISRQIPNIIGMSGTPIKNNASEYFSILNILYHRMFPSYSRFVNQWCDFYTYGNTVKTGGLRDPEAFQKWTNSFIIRRSREEVLPDLPKIQRHFQFENLSEAVEKAYENVMRAFAKDMDGEFTSAIEKSSCVLSYMNKMRHLTGLSKIKQTVEFLEDFLEQTDRKITVFSHHKDVMDILEKKLQSSEIVQQMNIKTVCFRAGDGQDKIDSFKNDSKCRILIASTIAAGEGLNLQFCQDFIMHERQWNPANEEQAEGRFPRIGSTANHITGTYMVAIGTIDEYFAELVERKRQIFKQTMGDKDQLPWDESSIMTELTEKIMFEGRKRWKI